MTAPATIDETVLADAVCSALAATPVVCVQHIGAAYAEMRAAPSYRTAILLAGWALRYAHEHRSDP